MKIQSRLYLAAEPAQAWKSNFFYFRQISRHNQYTSTTHYSHAGESMNSYVKGEVRKSNQFIYGLCIRQMDCLKHEKRLDPTKPARSHITLRTAENACCEWDIGDIGEKYIRNVLGHNMSSLISSWFLKVSFFSLCELVTEILSRFSRHLTIRHKTMWSSPRVHLRVLWSSTSRDLSCFQSQLVRQSDLIISAFWSAIRFFSQFLLGFHLVHQKGRLSGHWFPGYAFTEFAWIRHLLEFKNN